MNHVIILKEHTSLIGLKLKVFYKHVIYTYTYQYRELQFHILGLPIKGGDHLTENHKTEGLKPRQPKD